MKLNLNWFSNEIEDDINLKLSFKLILEFKLKMKVKFTFEIKIDYKNIRTDVNFGDINR